MTATIDFLKSQATGNDFILVLDRKNELSLSAGEIANLCNRQFGLGADGFIRVVATKYMSEDAISFKRSSWFMDYFNADGSLAEMCGNGARAFAHFLVTNELETETEFYIGTRAGEKAVKILSSSPTEASVAVNMGMVRMEGVSTVSYRNYSFQGNKINVGNPHLVVKLSSQQELDELQFNEIFGLDKRAFPNGANLEFYTIDNNKKDHLYMRVLERGVGETLSCGTGVVATAMAFINEVQPGLSTVTVTVPGGELVVNQSANGTILTGKSTVVAKGTAYL